MRSSKQVCAVVVTYNSEEYIRQCIESLLVTKDLAICVVDNDSQDQTLHILQEYAQRLIIIRSQENLGYAGGNNLGIKRAKKLGYKYVCIVNPDVVINTSSIHQLAKDLDSDADLAAVSPLITYSDSKTIWYAGAHMNESFESEMVGYRRPITVINQKKLVSTESINGAAVMMPIKIFQAVGYMREDFFLYCEEVEWSLRVREMGYRLACDRRVSVRHDVSLSTGGEGSLLQVYYYVRNILMLCKLHAPEFLPEQLRRRQNDYVKEILSLFKHPTQTQKLRRAYVMFRAVADFRAGRMGHAKNRF